MDNRNKDFLTDVGNHIDFALKYANTLFQVISEMKGALSDHLFELDDDLLQHSKPVTLFSGAYPWHVEELVEKIHEMPHLIGVKEMVNSGIYQSKTTLNKKFCDGQIPCEVYVESGNRRFFIRDKLLEYINENFN